MRLAAKDNKTTIRPSLLLLLIAMVGATIWGILNPKQDEDVGIELADHSATKAVNKDDVYRPLAQPQKMEAAFTLPKHQLTSIVSKDIFKSHNWVVAVSNPKLKAAPLLPPSAPPAPYIFIGKYETDAGESLIFLTSHNKVFTVKPGDNIDTIWRLDAEQGQMLKLTYLPLNLPQTISKVARIPTPATTDVSDPLDKEANS